MRLTKNKRCPRCGNKCEAQLTRCPSCELSFAKFDMATNKDAKIAIKEHRSEDCILRVGRPSDIKLFALLLLTIFLGFTGAHNYYVGRYKRGIGFTIFFIIGLINVCLVRLVPNLNTQSDLWQIFYLLVLGWGVVLILWIMDIILVSINRFKIPVSRNM